MASELTVAEDRLTAALARDRRALELLLTRSGLNRLDPESESAQGLAQLKTLLIQHATVRMPEELLEDWATAYCEAMALRRACFTTIFRIKDPGEKHVRPKRCTLCQGKKVVQVGRAEGPAEEQCPACAGSGRQAIDTAAARMQREQYMAAVTAWKTAQQAAAGALELLGIGKVVEPETKDAVTSFEEKLRALSLQRPVIDVSPYAEDVPSSAPLVVKVPSREELQASADRTP